MCKRLLILAMFCCINSLAAQPNSEAVGKVTSNWLTQQAQGQQASANKQEMAGTTAKNVYQRYQDSFTHPVPDKFSAEDSGTISK